MIYLAPRAVQPYDCRWRITGAQRIAEMNQREEKQGYEMLEHTADICIRAYGPTLEALFAESARGMTEFLFGAEALSLPVQEREEIRLTSMDTEALLVDWLAELLFRSSTGQRAYNEFDVQRLTDRELHAIAGWSAAEAQEEIKAVTHHALRIRRDETRGIWEARVVHDL